MFRSSGLFHGLLLWQKMKYEVLIAMLMVFMTIIFCTSLPKLIIIVTIIYLSRVGAT